MAYVRRKTVKGKTYCYLVKSVREGKRVRQVFVSYIGNPPPAAHRPCRDGDAQAPNSSLSVLLDFTLQRRKPRPLGVVRDKRLCLTKVLGLKHWAAVWARMAPVQIEAECAVIAAKPKHA